ncbi:MAG: hypothetical protein AAF745_06090 [Planctomycetota bacterium]
MMWMMGGRCWLIFGAVISLLVVGASVNADETDSAQSLIAESAWFDSESGGIRAVPVETTAVEAERRESRWSAKARPKNATNTTSNWNFNFDLSSILAWVVLITLAGLLIFIIVWLFRTSEFEFDRGGSDRRRTPQHSIVDHQTQQRMTQLPAEIRQSQRHPRVQVEGLMESGDYDQATIFLFAHQLLLLDRKRFLRLSRGKTNRRYLSETRRNKAAASSILKQTVSAFERSYFGEHSIDREEFEVLWKQNSALEAMVAGADGAAA